MMNDLIPVWPRQLGSELIQTVNARDLHEFLGNGDHFSTWIQDRIAQYDFAEGRDYVTFSESAEKGRPRKEYALTLDMAKELSMVERNQKGKEARQYFIECERRAKQAANQPIPLDDPYALRDALLGYAEKVISLTAERDKAIATKAHIGSKREASAMAKASVAVRQANQLRDQLGFNTRHATIIAVEKALDTKLAKNAYVVLRKWCKEKGVRPVEVADPRYGTVKAWPAGAWLEAHGIDLMELFDEAVAA